MGNQAQWKNKWPSKLTPHSLCDSQALGVRFLAVIQQRGIKKNGRLCNNHSRAASFLDLDLNSFMYGFEFGRTLAAASLRLFTFLHEMTFLMLYTTIKRW